MIKHVTAIAGEPGRVVRRRHQAKARHGFVNEAGAEGRHQPASQRQDGARPAIVIQDHNVVDDRFIDDEGRGGDDGCDRDDVVIPHDRVDDRRALGPHGDRSVGVGDDEGPGHGLQGGNAAHLPDVFLAEKRRVRLLRKPGGAQAWRCSPARRKSRGKGWIEWRSRCTHASDHCKRWHGIPATGR